ncbi:MAG: HlyC/CorC family transporter [Muribaculaceae bacterium]|nr:HlyC/CorC family transporter [Muribaculaceae bacterium]
MSTLPPLTLLIITIVAMIFSGFFSGMEIAFVSSNKVRVEIDLTKGGFTSKIIDIFFSNKDNFISTLVIGNNIVNVIYDMAIAGLLRPWLANILGGNDALILTAQTIVATAILLVTGEFLPKAVFRINPNYSIRLFSMPLFVCYCILWPISKFTQGLSALIMKLFGIKISKDRLNVITVDELDAYLQENIDKQEDENKEVEREVKIFENALDFSDTRLRDCMIPRNEIVGVDINETSREQLSELFTSSGLSKIVVFHDSIDNVLGFIQVSELFSPDVNWKTRIKPVIFAPETLLAKKMMQNLLSEKKSMAIVIDEFGGTSGLVTLEDLVEEIFGEIQDEHDRDTLTARKVAENIYEFAGRLEIEEINEQFHLDLPESDDYKTIAGFLLSKFEAIPAEGDFIESDGYKFTIMKKSATRIEMVRVEVRPTQQ